MRLERAAAVVLIALLGAGIVWYVLTGPLFAVDFNHVFYPVTRAWLTGDARLYTPSTAGFYHPPWTVLGLAPLSLLPYRPALAVLILLTLAALVIAVIVTDYDPHRRPWSLALTLFNLHTYDLLARGQIEVFAFVGLALGWIAYRNRQPWRLGLALVLLSVNAPNTLLLLALLWWMMWRQGGWRDGLRSALPLLATGLGSLLVFGLWPLRWVVQMRAYQPQQVWLTTIWRAAEQLGISPLVPWIVAGAVLVVTVLAWKRLPAPGDVHADRQRLLLILAATLLVTPYSLSYRLVALLVLALPYFIAHQPLIAVGLYGLTFTPLLRIWIGPENAWVDLALVLAVYVAVVVHLLHRNVTALADGKQQAGTGAGTSAQRGAL